MKRPNPTDRVILHQGPAQVRHRIEYPVGDRAEPRLEPGAPTPDRPDVVAHRAGVFIEDRAETVIGRILDVYEGGLACDKPGLLGIGYIRQGTADIRPRHLPHRQHGQHGHERAQDAGNRHFPGRHDPRLLVQGVSDSPPADASARSAQARRTRRQAVPHHLVMDSPECVTKAELGHAFRVTTIVGNWSAPYPLDQLGSSEL